MTIAWRGVPVLVTGATGLLGRWLVEALVERDARVVALVRDDGPDRRPVPAHLVDRVVVARGDVREAAVCERALAEHGIACVFHLAAQAIVAVANRSPVSTFDTNVRGTWTILEAARHAPAVRRVIVASSDKAYGDHDTLPYEETAALKGRNPYDASKAAADLIAQSYVHTFGLPVVITRCGNFFGGGDLNWNRIVPGTIRSAVHGERPVIRSDGLSVRDYLYVEDAVDAYLLLAEALSAGDAIAGQAFNVSYEQPLTVKEMVARVLAATGRPDLAPDVRNEASHEIREQYLDATRIRKLGWSPRVGLDEGLARTVRWYRRFLDAGPA